MEATAYIRVSSKSQDLSMQRAAIERAAASALRPRRSDPCFG